MPLRKKVPYSGKAKKIQLQKKKMSKNSNFSIYMSKLKDSSDDENSEINVDHSYIHKGTSNRYALKLHQETDSEVRYKKEIASQQINLVERNCLEVGSDVYYPTGLNFPRRPPWTMSMTRQELDMRENRYFTEYLKYIQKKLENEHTVCIDKNIENWRQLWRVTEMSDVLLFIVDIRYPNLLFPPYFYEYIVKEINKELIVVLNKVDLAPPPLVAAWKGYFEKQYPGLKIVMFTSFPSYNMSGTGGENSSKNKRRKGKLRMAAEGARKLQEVCQEIVQGNLDLSDWKEKIADEMNEEYEDLEIEKVISEKVDTSFFEHQKYKEGILTIGCVGQPNVGKSSLINALMGRKVVSVSRTPGHTKHFQTIFLTQNVRLCDCPGLVFPSTIPKALQVLLGSFPVAQLREPYTAIKYIAERVNLIESLKINHPSKEEEWSALDICEGWANKKGFFTAKAARPDTYRAANHLLRMALSGQISLCLMPPGYVEKEAEWESCADIEYIKYILANKGENRSDSNDLEEESSSSDSNEQSITDHESSSEEKQGPTTTVRNRFHLLDLTPSD